MRRTFVWAATLLIAAILVSCGGEEEKIEFTTTADGFKQVEAIDMQLQWKIGGGNIEIRVHSPEKGWIGVGFDPESIMKGANFIIGYVEDGTGFVEDHFGHKSIEHEKDTELGGSDDVTLIDASEDSQGTMLHFRIPLDSGDEFDKPLTTGSKHKVLLAYHTEDDFVSEHTKSTRTSLELEL